MALTFKQKLQTLMNHHKVEKSAPSVNIEWDVLMSMVGGNHGDADAVVRYLEEKEGLTISNAVPSGDIICIRWGNVRPPLKY